MKENIYTYIKLNTVKTVDIKLLPPGLTHAMIILSPSVRRDNRGLRSQKQDRWNNTMVSMLIPMSLLALPQGRKGTHALSYLPAICNKENERQVTEGFHE